MTEYRAHTTRIGGSTSHGISPGRGKIRLRLALKDGSEGLILNLSNVFYLPNSPCNLLSLGLLNNSGIYHDNENETLYEIHTRQILAQAQRWRNSYLLKPLNLSDGAVNLLRVDNATYQGPPNILHTASSPASVLPLSVWHKRLGHTNFPSLKTFLRRLSIPFSNDSDGYICDSCQRAKATKVYNRGPQKRVQRPYQLVHTDLVGPIKPIGFAGERYFFTFTDDCTRMTDTYTGSKKSDWLKCLKNYHSLCRTRSREEHPIEGLRSDYGSELQSHNADDWLQREGITFEPSAPYSQEQNGVSERMGRTIMDMTRATILEGNIDDDLWPELVLAMTYIKNSRPTRALENISPYEAQFHKQPDLTHLRIFGSTVYVLLHEEERLMKSEKWAPRALKGILVGYDGQTIYRVHIREQQKVIRVKDLRIFEDYEAKKFTKLPDYSDDMPTFQEFLLEDNDEKEPESHAGRKVNSGREEEQEMPIPRKDRKVDAREEEHSTSRAQKSRKVTSTTRVNAENEPKGLYPCAGKLPKDAIREQSEQYPQRSRTGRIVKLSAKAQEAMIQANHQNPPAATKNAEVEKLIVQLTKILENWDEGINVLAAQHEEEEDSQLHLQNNLADNDAEDPVVLLASKVYTVNAGDLDQFVCSTQFDVEEPETYARAMQGPNAAQWAKAMKEELDQLHKNET